MSTIGSFTMTFPQVDGAIAVLTTAASEGQDTFLNRVSQVRILPRAHHKTPGQSRWTRSVTVVISVSGHTRGTPETRAAASRQSATASRSSPTKARDHLPFVEEKVIDETSSLDASMTRITTDLDRTLGAPSAACARRSALTIRQDFAIADHRFQCPPSTDVEYIFAS